jgi:hypothetical protein
MNLNLSMFTASLNGLTDLQKTAFEKSIKEADVNRDNVLDLEEFKKATKTFSETDEFKSLSAENKKSFTEKLNPDTIWGQQGASSVTNYDGNKLQAEYYEKLLNDPTRNKGADGKPLVTKEQLDYAKKNGFGDVNGDRQITGLELAVADLNGDKKIDVTDGDISGDGKVNKDDRGVDLRSSETSNNSSKGFDSKKLMEFLQKLIQIWSPQAAGKIQIPQMSTAAQTTTS